eukprot:gene3146-5462_t
MVAGQNSYYTQKPEEKTFSETKDSCSSFFHITKDEDISFGTGRLLFHISSKDKKEYRFVGPKDSEIKLTFKTKDQQLFQFYASFGLTIDMVDLKLDGTSTARQSLESFSNTDASRLVKRYYEIDENLLIVCKNTFILFKVEDDSLKKIKSFSVPVGYQQFIIDFIKLKNGKFITLLNNGCLQMIDFENEKALYNETNTEIPTNFKTKFVTGPGCLEEWNENYLIFSYLNELKYFDLNEFKTTILLTFDQPIQKVKKLKNGNYGILSESSLFEYKFVEN